MPVTIQLRRDTASAFAASNNTLVLAAGEMALVTDERYAVVGDGTSDFATLSTEQKRFYYNNDRGRTLGGFSDVVQLTVKGHASQSAGNPIFKVVDSGNNDIYKVSSGAATALEVTARNMTTGTAFLLSQPLTSTASNTFELKRQGADADVPVFQVTKSGRLVVKPDADLTTKVETSASMVVKGSGANNTGIFEVQSNTGTVLFRIKDLVKADGTSTDGFAFVRGGLQIGDTTQLCLFKSSASPSSFAGESGTHSDFPYYALTGFGTGASTVGQLNLTAGSSASTAFIQCRRVGSTTDRFRVMADGTVECGSLRSSSTVAANDFQLSGAARNTGSISATATGINTDQVMTRREIMNYVEAMFDEAVAINTSNSASFTVPTSPSGKKYFVFLVEFFKGTQGSAGAIIQTRAVGVFNPGATFSPSAGFTEMSGFHMRFTP
tara:strand:- start:11889 stop:13202 length:1314 start_codon:yes stop_codon:yes gene_type:complete